MPEDFIAFMRKHLGGKMSQAAFERAMGYKDNGFRDVMKGKKPPLLQDLGRMAEILGLTAAEARTFRVLALKAHGYHDLAEELRSLHTRVDALAKRLDQLERDS